MRCKISSLDLFKLFKKNGWELKSTRGSHHKFIKEGFQPVVIQHPVKDIPKGTLNKILKQANLK